MATVTPTPPNGKPEQCLTLNYGRPLPTHGTLSIASIHQSERSMADGWMFAVCTGQIAVEFLVRLASIHVTTKSLFYGIQHELVFHNNSSIAPKNESRAMDCSRLSRKSTCDEIRRVNAELIILIYSTVMAAGIICKRLSWATPISWKCPFILCAMRLANSAACWTKRAAHEHKKTGTLLMRMHQVEHINDHNQSFRLPCDEWRHIRGKLYQY